MRNISTGWYRAVVEQDMADLGDVTEREMPDYPPDTSAVVWDDWSGRDDGTLPYPESYEQDAECLGHPDGPVMGETFYCDGSCRPGFWREKL